MIVYVAIEESYLSRLEEIEKKYLDSVNDSKNSRQISPKDPIEAEGDGLYFDAECEAPKPQTVNEEIKDASNNTASVTKSLSKNESLTLQQLIPFLPKRKIFRAKKLLEELKDSDIKISKSGQVYFKDHSYKDLNGIDLVRSVINPRKNKPVGSEIFENFLVEEGLGSFIAPYTTRSRIKGANALPKNWYFIGDS